MLNGQIIQLLFKQVYFICNFLPYMIKLLTIAINNYCYPYPIRFTIVKGGYQLLD